MTSSAPYLWKCALMTKNQSHFGGASDHLFLGARARTCAWSLQFCSCQSTLQNRHFCNFVRVGNTFENLD